MLSGNGRHRRPRQAPAFLVAAGVTGSAIAIPLMGASGASAADGATWDKVAECETGGSWSANAGNGYYGGLQFTQEDWEKYGGLDYAPSADQASRSQQIAVAEKILADRGPEAWPACGPASGLDKQSGAANVDTGVGDAAPGYSGSPETSAPSLSGGLGLSSPSQSPDESSGSPDSLESPTAAPEPTSSPSASPAKPSPSTSSSPKEKKSAKPDTSPEADVIVPALPSFLPPIAPELGYLDNSVYAQGDSALVDTGTLDADRSASRGGNDVRTNMGGSYDSYGAYESYASHESYGSYSDSYGSYAVRSGDSLESVADHLDVQGGWGALYDANR